MANIVSGVLVVFYLRNTDCQFLAMWGGSGSHVAGPFRGAWPFSTRAHAEQIAEGLAKHGFHFFVEEIETIRAVDTSRVAIERCAQGLIDAEKRSTRDTV